MKILRIAVALLLAPSAFILLAQIPVPAKDAAPPHSSEPLIADVHASPYRPLITLTVNIRHQRFDMRNATIVNMIDFVRGQPDDDGREDLAIVGGPPWIDFDRFDVAVMVPDLNPANANASQPNYGIYYANPDAKIQPIVARILAERFHLKSHSEDRPLPGYIMTVGKDGAKLAEAKDLDAPNSCQGAPDKSNPGQVLIACTSETIAQFLATIGGTFRHPILDRTALTKPYDFTLRFSSEQLRTREDTIHAYIDAIGKQLGLAIVPGDVPQPAFVVDAVDRTPTPNPPDIAKLIPAMPDLEFEVATIKPAADNEPQDTIRPAGSQITFSAFNLQGLLTRAFELPTGAMLGDALATLSPRRYTILVKLPPDIDARVAFQDQDQIDDMLKKLLIDRFQIKYHWGEQTLTGYVLLAGTPKMKKADPNSRTFCKYGPPEGEKDVRIADSPFNGEFHCQNVTMDQLASLVQAMAKAEIKNRVPNKTGLAGSYDFALYYTSGRKMALDAAAAEAAAKRAGDASLSDPIGGLSIEDAFRKQLGLKLEKQSGSFPSLVLDHIEQTPTEN
jgi:uncharacterized protein (TIGR03435 family)